VRTFQPMGCNFQPRAAAAPRPLYQLCGCATTTVAGCWPNVTAEVCCRLFLGVFGGIRIDLMGYCWIRAGVWWRCTFIASHGGDREQPHCLPTRHLCHWLRGAFTDAVASQHKVNGGEVSESIILMPPAQTESPGHSNTPGCLLKMEAALPNSKQATSKLQASLKISDGCYLEGFTHLH